VRRRRWARHAPARTRARQHQRGARLAAAQPTHQLHGQPGVGAHHGQLLRRDEARPVVRPRRHHAQHVLRRRDGQGEGPGRSIQRGHHQLPAGRHQGRQGAHEGRRLAHVLDDLGRHHQVVLGTGGRERLSAGALVPAGPERRGRGVAGRACAGNRARRAVHMLCRGECCPLSGCHVLAERAGCPAEPSHHPPRAQGHQRVVLRMGARRQHILIGHVDAMHLRGGGGGGGSGSGRSKPDDDAHPPRHARCTAADNRSGRGRACHADWEGQGRPMDGGHPHPLSPGRPGAPGARSAARRRSPRPAPSGPPGARVQRPAGRARCRRPGG